MAITQAKQDKAADTVVATLTSVSEDVYMKQQGSIKIGLGTGDPNGLLTAPIGSKWTDVTTGILWINSDASTAWVAVQTAGALTKTPTVCGERIEVLGKQYIAAYAAATTVGKVYQLTHVNTSGQEITAATSADLGDIETRVGVAYATNASAAIGWFQVGGLAEAYVDGDTDDVAAGDHLKLAGLDLLLDGTSGSTVKTNQSCAVAVDLNAGAAAVKTVMMLDEPVGITSPLDVTPIATGMTLQVGAKQYFSAYHAGATVGAVYTLDANVSPDTAGQEVVAIGTTTLTIPQRLGVALSSTAGITWYQVGGIASALVKGDGSAVTAKDFLEATNGVTHLVTDHSTVITANSFATAIEATSAAAALKSVFLLNREVAIAAS